MATLYINQRKRCLSNSVTYVHRTIPGKATMICVREGDEVMPGTVLGEGQVPSGFRTINMARQLGVDPSKVFGLLKRKLGQPTYEGELLAEKEGVLGLGKKIIQAPADGIVDLIDPQTGILRFQLLPKLTKLASGVYGIVDKVDNTRVKVVIRTLAARVYGAFGSGKEREGMLHVLGTTADLISSKQISPDMKGKIIVGGGLVFGDALEKAKEVGVAGLISGGINAYDFQSINAGQWLPRCRKWVDVGISLMITEGFGDIPLGADLFPLLQAHEGKFAMLDGNRGRLILPSHDPGCMMTIRNTKMVDGLEVEPTIKDTTVLISANLKVRVLGEPFWGVQGVVESIDKTPTRLPSGLIIPLVTVVTSQKKLRVPYSNIEALA